MKRLITNFMRLWRLEDVRRSLMTLLLFSSVNMVWADYINIWGGETKQVDLNYSGGVGTAETTLKADTEYRFTFFSIYGETKTEYGLSKNELITGSDSKYSLTKSSGNCGIIKTPIAGKCKFTVTWDGEKGYVTVEFPMKDKLRYKIQGTDIYAYADIDYSTGSGITNINLYDDKTYEFQMSDGSGNWYGAGNSTMKEENCTDWNFNANNKSCKIETSAKTGDYERSRVYTFKIKWNESTPNVSVVYNKVSDYYLIVPDENVGNTPRAISGDWVPEGHKAFKMIGARERNQEIINPELSSVTLKIDGDKGRQLRYDSGGRIRFYIYDKANGRYYQPGEKDLTEANTEKTNASAGSRFEYVNGKNVELIPRYRTSNERDAIGRSHNDIKDEKQGGYYYINRGSAKYTIGGVDYPTMTLTFMFSQYNAEKNYYDDNKVLDGHFTNGNCIYYVNEGKRTLGNAKLLVAFLKTRAYNPRTNTCAKYYEEHIIKTGNNTPAGVYLVGNMGGKGYMNGSETETSETETSETDKYDKDKYNMKPDYWYDGVIDNKRTDIQNADSIVYSVEIKRGDASWDNFFLSFTTGDVLGTNDMWNPLLRPRIQNKMDAQALEGGIFYYLTKNSTGDSDQAQAINPLLTASQKERYASYRIYFNATYSTYRIAFSEKFCIGGPAVNGFENRKVNDDEMFGADYRHGLDYVPASNGMPEHYIYENKKFCQGSTFAFFGDAKSAKDNYAEDNDKVEGNVKKEWETQAPKEGGDYAFYNRVSWTSAGGSNGQSVGSGRNAILWTLPTGYYTLRFYNHKSNTETGDANDHAFYTIDKKVVLNNASSTYPDDSGNPVTENRGGLRTFSDDCALVLPAGVQAYYVPAIKEGKAVLREVGRIIPAHCPVLIYDRSQREGSKTIRLSPSPIDHTKAYSGYTKRLAEGEPNLLVDCYDKDRQLMPVETAEDGKTKYNYYMTNEYYLKDVPEVGDEAKPVPLNFWRTLPNSTAKKNYTYLSVDTNIFPLAYTGYKNYEYETNPENVKNDARSYCFILSFDGEDDGSVVTGITSVEDNVNNAGNNAWYTIQGVKISTSVMPGIYIHNGKKLIIK